MQYFILVTRLIGYLLNTTPTIEAATTAALRYLFQYSGFNVKKLTDNEMVNTLRICCIADFQLHNQNLQRISERKIPVLMAYCITDRLIEHQIFNENCQALRLKTIDEIASLNNRQGIAILPVTKFTFTPYFYSIKCLLSKEIT